MDPRDSFPLAATCKKWAKLPSHLQRMIKHAAWPETPSAKALMDAVDPWSSFIPDAEELAYDPNLASEAVLRGRASVFMCLNCGRSCIFRRSWTLCDKDAPYSSTPVWCET